MDIKLATAAVILTSKGSQPPQEEADTAEGKKEMEEAKSQATQLSGRNHS